MADITSNLVAWYKLDETSGTIAADSSGNGYTGTYTNSPTLNQTGAWSGGKAVAFSSASSQYVTVADNDNFSSHSSTAQTVACWVKPTSFGTGKTIVSKAAAANYEFALQTTSTGAIRCDWFKLDGSGSNVVGSTSPTATLSSGVWYHVVVVYEYGVVIRLYINGTLNNTSTSFPVTTSNGTGLLNIGRRGDGTQYADSTLDDVRIYSRALSAGDVAALYAWQPTVVSNSRLVNSGGFNRNTFSALVNN